MGTEQANVDEVDHGTVWHPKPEKFDEDGLLPDLEDDQVAEHMAKPEADEQPDGSGRLLDHDGDEG